MPITFSSKHFENILMFDNVAKALLILMGHSGTVPGAFKSGEVPQALAHLEAGLKQEQQNTQPSTKEIENDDADYEVDLATRAIPLINMLKSAIKHHCNVMWQ